MKFKVNNYQLRLDTNTLKALDIQKQICFLLDIMKIEYETTDFSAQYKAIYFDDKQKTLLKSSNKASLRIESKKRYNENKLISILAKFEVDTRWKFPKIITKECIQDKNLDDILPETTPQYTENINNFKDISFIELMEHLEIENKELEPQIIVNKISHQIKIKDNENINSETIIFVEEFYFIDIKTKISSSKLCEVGCERRKIKNEKLIKTEKTLMERLFNAISTVLDLKEVSETKYMLAMNWLKQQQQQQIEDDGYENVNVFGVDIVGFSKHPSSIQKTLITKLHELIRETLKDMSEKDNTLLNTGDGAYVVFKDGDVLSAYRLANLLTPKINIFNEQQGYAGGEKLLLIRIGLHIGYGFKIRLGEQINYAGDVINMTQRVMDGGIAKQLLISDDYRKVVVNNKDALESTFHGRYRIKIKHDDTEGIIVSNICHNNIGIQSKPIGLIEVISD